MALLQPSPGFYLPTRRTIKGKKAGLEVRACGVARELRDTLLSPYNPFKGPLHFRHLIIFPSVPLMYYLHRSA